MKVHGIKMKSWQKYPVIYEINSWVWLQELSGKYKIPVTFANVPDTEWNSISELKIDAVWFMGVWERSPKGIAVSNKNSGLLEDFQRALPDYTIEDNVGSPYCVRGYSVDEHLGGAEGLACARKELAKRGVKLILDFVPNHIAQDHPWVSRHPEYFIRGNIDDVKRDPVTFVEIKRQVFACGKDPYFPAWQDTLQMNAFNPGLRAAAIRTLSDIADQCDGARCDMAMLLINSVFERTWAARAGTRPATEYWVDVISAVKIKNPDFLFMAEAYWGMEWELQQQGFDFCYDKCLYDRLKHDSAESVRLHLSAEPSYQDKLLRFIENHDEMRAHAAFSPEEERAAAVVIATIPGAKLFHEGQLEGRKVRLPVFLRRRPFEPMDHDRQEFYRVILKIASMNGMRRGHWQLCQRSGWPDNATFQNLVAWCWQSAKFNYLIVVNLSTSRSQGRIKLPFNDMKNGLLQMTDLFTGKKYEWKSDEILSQGLFVDLPPWGYHLFITKRGSGA